MSSRTTQELIVLSELPPEGQGSICLSAFCLERLGRAPPFWQNQFLVRFISGQPLPLQQTTGPGGLYPFKILQTQLRACWDFSFRSNFGAFQPGQRYQNPPPDLVVDSGFVASAGLKITQNRPGAQKPNKL